jgi:hypothetical protein
MQQRLHFAKAAFDLFLPVALPGSGPSSNAHEQNQPSVQRYRITSTFCSISSPASASRRSTSPLA